MDLLESLGAWSICHQDVIKLLRLLMANQKAGNVGCCCRMLRAMSHMAAPNDHRVPRYYLDLQAEDSVRCFLRLLSVSHPSLCCRGF
jgi:hypothetical protein